MKKAWGLVSGALLLLSMACRPVRTPAEVQVQSRSLTVYCPHPRDFVAPLVREFEAESGIKVEVVSAGTGELLQRIEAEQGAPAGDIMWGGSRASLASCSRFFAPYTSANEPAFMAPYIDPARSFTPFTVIPTVIMYNKELVAPADVPRGWKDLLEPKWKGRIAFADPALSSSSFEGLVNMLYAMGNGKPDQGWGYVKRLVANLDGKLLGGSSAVYKGVANSDYPIGITFEEAAAKYIRQGTPVGIIYPAEGTVIECDGVAILKGARNPANARKFVDFITGRSVQTRIARDLDRRSARGDVAPASGLQDLKAIKVIPGDALWSSRNRDVLLEKFKVLTLP